MKSIHLGANLGAILAACALAGGVSAQASPSTPGEEPVTEVRIIGLRSDPADSLEYVGLSAYSDGVYDDAEDAFLDAILASRRAGTDPKRDPKRGPTLAQLHSNLAWLYHEMGRFTEADSVLRLALDLDTKAHGADSPAAVRRTVELAMLHQAAGRYKGAAPLLDHVIALHAKDPKADPREVAFALHLVARNYYATGDPKESEKFFKRVLDSLDEDETMDASLWSTTMLDLAELYHASHRDQEAREAFSKALARANRLYADSGLPNALVLNPYSVLLRRAEAVRATGDSARR
jgi:tetratricopeptide (TPR) repeat protein